MPYLENSLILTILVGATQLKGRPHPNLLPEGEGTFHSEDKE